MSSSSSTASGRRRKKRTRQHVQDEEAPVVNQEEFQKKLAEGQRFYSKPTAVLNAPFAQHFRIFHEYKGHLDPVTLFMEGLEADRAAFRSLEQRTGGQALQPLNPGLKEQLEPAQMQLAQDLHAECQLLQRAVWKKHVQFRDIFKPTSPLEIKEAMRCSWVLVCQWHLMQARLRDVVAKQEGMLDWPEELLKRAHDFKFMVHVNRHRAPVILSDDCIGGYSVNVLMNSLTLWIDAVDTYGWSPSAGQYLEALWLRYCLIVHQPGREVGEGHDVDEWGGRLPLQPIVPAADNDPMEEEEKEEPEQRVANYDDIFLMPAMPDADERLFPAPLNTAFLDVAEQYFFHCWWHHQSLQSLFHPFHNLPWRLELHQARAAWRVNQGLPALIRVLHEVLKDNVTRDSLMSSLASHYPQRLPWVGQKEQMMHMYPNEAADGEAEAMLSRMRPDTYQELQKLLHFDKDSSSDPMRFVRDYATQEHGLADFLLQHYQRPVNPMVPDAEDEEAPPPPPLPMPFTEAEWLDKDRVRTRLGLHPERFVLLFIEQTVNRALITIEEDVMTSHGFLSVRTLDGAKARPPKSLLSYWLSCEKQGKWPMLTAIWQNYVVMGPGTPYWLWTPHLVDALGAWVRLARDVVPHAAEQLKSQDALNTRAWRQLAMPLELLDQLPTLPS